MSGGNGILRHTLRRPEGLIECSSVLDIGAGIRPFAWYKPRLHICVEPFGPYCDMLSRHPQYSVFRGTAEQALSVLKADCVLMLDVLEHMEKDAALRVLEMAKRAALRQVVVYTPEGFKYQEGDAWGLGGDEWQRHRSGWIPMDFEGWSIEREGASFFAVWNA